MTRDEFYQHLKNHLRTLPNAVEDFEWSNTDNLFDLGLLESFDLPQLVHFLEELLGRRVELRGRTIDSFQSMAAIYQTFVVSDELVS